MFFSKKLKRFKNINHYFFSRKNGYSSGCYESLNCGSGSSDSKENVFKNLKIVSQRIGCKNESLITLNQIHSNKVIYFEKEGSLKNKVTGDAIITKIKNIGLGILTADCAPILLYNPKKNIIGGIHSGWKGALNGIIKNTFEKLNEINSKNSDLIVVIGPCIKKENYKVKIDFYDKFMSKNQKNKCFFEKINRDSYFFDLRGFINNEISSLNVKNIENIDMDTYSNEENFFSYRRSKIRKEKDYGRCISVILMT